MCYQAIEDLLGYALRTGLIEECDRTWAANRLLQTLGLESWEPPQTVRERPLEDILKELLDDAAARGVIQNDITSRDLFDTELMGILTPRPAQVISEFRRRYQADLKEATDWFYRFCQDTDYIRRYRVARDRKWKAATPYGELEITINLTKPEKDPKTIALERLQPKSGYPACMLCKENIGYAGRINFPARQTHRIVPITLAGEQFYLQYSPYAYFHEHCIMLHEQHKPMEMNKQTLAEIFDFVGQFPHYTCGSNADLPIVGGSILSHSHFQGGRYVFPMQKADIAVPMTDIRYPGVKAGILNWPVSAVRLVGRSSQQMQNVANNILSAWRSYTDESVGILAETDGTPHNTVTPILHYDETEGYILDLALRNNRTSEEYPDGIFHPHKEYHNIKKENIGLIEVMGLAILPARLKDQGAQIAEILAGQRPNTSREAGDTLAVHADWIDELIAKYGTHMKPQDANKAVKAEIGTVFSHVLENAGVFKQDAAGQAAFVRFMQSVGFKKA